MTMQATAAAVAPATREPRPLGRAVFWLAVLGVLFFGTYNSANWYASTRIDVPVFVFEWERSIPFWPWTIVPYWSIDLIYGITVLLCATRAELAMHVKRLLTAQVVSVTCFVLVPLRFSFDRPAVDGVFGVLFDTLGAFDKPFNQAPSLHMSLLVILWVRVLAHVQAPALRGLVNVWMTIIGVSVLTTWQHHFIDVPTGLAVGFLCLWLFPEQGPGPFASWRRSADPQRRRLAIRYLGGAVACAVVGAIAGGGALWLFWPAVALALVALSYHAIGETGFQKGADGQLSVGARWLLAPYLVGARINALLWTRDDPAPQHVADGVWIGRLPGPRDRAEAPGRGLVDVCAELPAPPGLARYASHPMLDLVVPPAATLTAAAASIERLRADGPVLVACALGYSRSAATIAAWLLATGRAQTSAEAIEIVARARPRIVLGPDHRAALEKRA
jgi:hypothetical protein